MLEHDARTLTIASSSRTINTSLVWDQHANTNVQATWIVIVYGKIAKISYFHGISTRAVQCLPGIFLLMFHEWSWKALVCHGVLFPWVFIALTAKLAPLCQQLPLATGMFIVPKARHCLYQWIWALYQLLQTCTNGELYGDREGKFLSMHNWLLVMRSIMAVYATGWCLFWYCGRRHMQCYMHTCCWFCFRHCCDYPEACVGFPRLITLCLLMDWSFTVHDYTVHD